MIKRNKDTEREYSKKKKIETSGIKEVKDIKEKIKAIKAGIKELKGDREENKIEVKAERTAETKETKSIKEEKMYVIPLGGLEEVGKNMTVIQYRDEIIIIDSGVTFPDDKDRKSVV